MQIQIKKDKFGKKLAYYLEFGDINGRTGMAGLTLEELLKEIEDEIRDKFEKELGDKPCKEHIVSFNKDPDVYRYQCKDCGMLFAEFDEGD